MGTRCGPDRAHRKISFPRSMDHVEVDEAWIDGATR